MESAILDSRPVEILLVDDSPSDAMLAREGFAQSKLKVNLHHVTNGQRCLAFLRKQGEFAQAPTPDLVLLDLNMPVMDGREVLAEVVKDDRLNHLPIVILTTSKEECDVRMMYKLRCSAYANKSMDFDEFSETLQGIADFWFGVAILPSRNP